MTIDKNHDKMKAKNNIWGENMKKEIRLLSRAFRDYRREIFKLFKAELSETDNLLNSLKDDLINYDEMSEQGADIICENLNGAVMLYKGKNLPVVMSVEVSDVSDISEETESKTFEEEQPEEKDYSQSEIIDRGKCGDNAEWTLYGDGTLVISGSGDMYDYNWDFKKNGTSTDWYDYKNIINDLKVEKGITKIGRMAFWGTHLKSVTLPEELQMIGVCAFRLTSLTSITLPENVQKISSDAFSDCKKLKEIKIPLKLKRYMMHNWDEHWIRKCNAKIVYMR